MQLQSAGNSRLRNGFVEEQFQKQGLKRYKTAAAFVLPAAPAAAFCDVFLLSLNLSAKISQHIPIFFSHNKLSSASAKISHVLRSC
jgi:hypothetical protein